MRLAVLLAAAAVAFAIDGVAGWPGVDLWRPWVACRAAVAEPYSRAGREELFRLHVAGGGSGGRDPAERDAAMRVGASDAAALGYEGLDLVQTPFLLAAVRLARGEDYGRDRVLFFAVSLACFLGAAFALGRAAGLDAPTALGVAAALVLLLDAEAGELKVANVANLQLALVAAFVVLQGRDRDWAQAAAGAALLLAVALKPNAGLVPVAVALAWAGERRWRRLAVAGAGAAAAVALAWALPALVVPRATWGGWLGTLPETLGGAQPLQSGNVSLPALLSHAAGLDASLPLALAGLAALGAAALRPLRGVPPPAGDRTLLAVAAGGVLPVVVARLAWVHYLVLALPAIVLAVRTGATRAGPRGWAILLALLPLTTPATRLLVRSDRSATLAAAAWDGAALVLLGVALAGLWRGGRAPAAS
jgi:hypothetical protein